MEAARRTAVSEDGELLREVHREEIDILARLSYREPKDHRTLVRRNLRHELHGSVTPCRIFEPYRVAHELTERVLIAPWRDGGAFYSARPMPHRAHRISEWANKRPEAQHRQATHDRADSAHRQRWGHVRHQRSWQHDQQGHQQHAGPACRLTRGRGSERQRWIRGSGSGLGSWAASLSRLRVVKLRSP